MSPRLTRARFWLLASAAALAGSAVAAGVSADTTRLSKRPNHRYDRG